MMAGRIDSNLWPFCAVFLKLKIFLLIIIDSNIWTENSVRLVLSAVEIDRFFHVICQCSCLVLYDSYSYSYYYYASLTYRLFVTSIRYSRQKKTSSSSSRTKEKICLFESISQPTTNQPTIIIITITTNYTHYHHQPLLLL